MVKIKRDEWLKNYLNKITDIGKTVMDDGPVNDYFAYSALKLISIYYYSDPFLKVAKNDDRLKQGYDGAVYIELFGGAGLVKLNDTGDVVAGSALCAISDKTKNFDYVICVEKDPERKQALENRLAKIIRREKFDVIQGDCNKCIKDVISLIKTKFKNPIVLTFVDPEGMEIKWSTLQTLSDAFNSQDFMINVSSSGATRVKGKLEKGDLSPMKTWEEYWGNEDAKDILLELAKGSRVEQEYQEKISRVLGKPMGATIAIRDNGNIIAYYILGYTRETIGGSGYARVFTALKERLEKEDRRSVKRFLDVIHKRTSTLD